MLSNNSLPPGCLKIINTLQANGHQAYLVGGSVRDILLGKIPKEWDVTTSALPKDVTKLFKKVIPTGIKYGTVTVLLEDGQYEVTTFRCDEKYVDGRHPSNVKFTDDIHRDLSRRDFTVNAMAYNPSNDKLIDDHAGKTDLDKKIIRTVGKPLDRFKEDGLRSIRACRFASTLGFTIEKMTFEAIGQTLKVTKKVAPERIRDELVKMLSADKPSIGFELMRQSGLLKLFMPELEACCGIEQPPQYHKYDVYWHSVYACDAAEKGNIPLRLAALLHDIAKPKCKKDYTFYNHDQAGIETAKKILKRLRFSNDTIKKVVNLIANHMFNYTRAWSDAAVRRFLVRLGSAENVKDLFALRLADTRAMEREIDSEYLNELQNRIDKIMAEQNALHVTDLKIDGKDVMRTLKLKPGPEVGKILHALLNKVLDDPTLNQRELLIGLIRKETDRPTN